MPSGSKRRKAAKKKKEKEAAHHHNHHHHPQSADVHSHGDDDLKHHDDDKESDAEEVSSPASQEHANNPHQFTDGEKEEGEKEDGSYVQSPSEESKSFEGLKEEATQTAIVEEQVVETDVELNSNNAIVEDFETQKEANGGVLLQSLDEGSVVQIENSKPASDKVNSKKEFVENIEPKIEGNDGVLLQSMDESSVVESETNSKPDSYVPNSKNAIVENVGPQKEAYNGVLLQSIDERSVVQMETDSKPSSDQLKSENAIVETVEPQKEAGDGPTLQSLDGGRIVEIEGDLNTMDEPESKNEAVKHTELLKESTDGGLSQSQNEESHIVDNTKVVVDNGPFVNSTEAVNSLSEGLTQVTNSFLVGDGHSSDAEIKFTGEMEKVKLLDGKINGNASVSADSNGEMKENEDKEMILRERNGSISPACVDLGPDNRLDEAIVKTDDSVDASDVKLPASNEIREKLTVSYNVQQTHTANGADSSHSTTYVEHLKDSEVSKSPHCQPTVASAPQVVQRTSWMGCCGLFEVFAGSNR